MALALGTGAVLLVVLLWELDPARRSNARSPAGACSGPRAGTPSTPAGL